MLELKAGNTAGGNCVRIENGNLYKGKHLHIAYYIR